MNVNGYELSGDWQVSNIGHTTTATKAGKKYFLKRYGTYKMPRRDESTAGPLYEKLAKKFTDFMEYRIAINRALSELSGGPGGNIIPPNDWFLDDIQYIEATEFVNGVVDDKDALQLPIEDKFSIILTATAALYNIHRKNIVHSDLKRTNMLVVRNEANKYVGKIIDFDMSYFADNIRPRDIGGDQNYMSPELAKCFMSDMAEEDLKHLSTKSDIFSLGLILYNYFTGGEQPKIEGLTGKLKEKADNNKVVYCCNALLNGAHLIVSSKIKNAKLSKLIASMLSLKPNDRPTALEVLNKLKEIARDLGINVFGNAAAPTETVREPLPVVRGLCEPWEEHGIKFNEKVLHDNHFVGIERAESGTVKCYSLCRENGEKRIFTSANLLLLGIAVREDSGTKRNTAVSDAGLLANDTEITYLGTVYRLDMNKIKNNGYVRVEKSTQGGIEGYKLIKADGKFIFYTAGSLKRSGYLISK